MSADLKWLRGKVVDDPQQEAIDLEGLLQGLLKALIAEQVREPVPAKEGQ